VLLVRPAEYFRPLRSAGICGRRARCSYSVFCTSSAWPGDRPLFVLLRDLILISGQWPRAYPPPPGLIRDCRRCLRCRRPMNSSSIYGVMAGPLGGVLLDVCASQLVPW